MITVKIRKIRFFVVASIIVLLQQCFTHRFQLGWFHFDLMAIMAAYIVIYSDGKNAINYILILGLLRDLGSMGGFGLSFVSFFISAIILLLIKEVVSKNNLLSDLLLSFVFVMNSMILYNILASHAPRPLLFYSFCTAIMSMFLTPPLFFLLKSSGVIKVIKTTF